jgi:double stranded RNA-specific editase B
VENLPEMYKLNVPRLNLLSSPEVRQPGKAPNYSVNWAKGYDLPEVIDAMKGKEQVTKVSKKLSVLFILIYFDRH